MASNLSHGMKRALAGVMALLIVAGSSGLPANVGGFLTGSTSIVASAEDNTVTWNSEFIRNISFKLDFSGQEPVWRYADNTNGISVTRSDNAEWDRESISVRNGGKITFISSDSAFTKIEITAQHIDAWDVPSGWSSSDVLDPTGSEPIKKLTWEGTEASASVELSSEENIMIDEISEIKFTLGAIEFVSKLTGEGSEVSPYQITSIDDLTEYLTYADYAREDPTNPTYIQLTSDISTTSAITFNKNTVLDLNGKSLTIAPSGQEDYSLSVSEGFSLTIKDSNPGENKLEVTGASYNDGNGIKGQTAMCGTICLESGKVSAIGGSGDYVINNNAGADGGDAFGGGSLSVSGGILNLTGGTGGDGYIDNHFQSGNSKNGKQIADGVTVQLSGGTVNFEPTAAQLVSGYTANDNGDGTWTIQEIPAVTYTHHAATDATCTTAGNIEYYLGSDGKYYSDDQGTLLTDQNNDSVVDENDVVKPATGHTYGNPVWTWNEGYTAKATFACEKQDDTQVIDATVTSQTTAPTYTADGKTVYTAKVTFGGTDYIDTQTVTLPKLTLAGATLNEDTTLSGDLAITTGGTCTVDGCVVVFESNLTLNAGTDAEHAATLALKNNAVVVINGNLTLNDYSKITAEDGCKVIVVGEVDQSETGTAVTDGAVLTEGFYPADMTGAISYTPATETANGYFMIGENEKHYAFKDNKFAEFTEYDLTVPSGITVTNSRNKTVTGKLSGAETYTLTSDSAFIVLTGGEYQTASKGETDTQYTLTLSNVSGAVHVLTGAGTEGVPIIVTNEKDLRAFANTEETNGAYVKIDNDITLNEDLTVSEYQRLHFVGSGTIKGTGKIICGNSYLSLSLDGINIENEIVFGDSNGDLIPVTITAGSISKITANYDCSLTIEGGTVGTVIDNSNSRNVKIKGGTVGTLTLNGCNADISGGTVTDVTANRGEIVISGNASVTKATVNSGSLKIDGGTVGTVDRSAQNTEEPINIRINGGMIGAFTENITAKSEIAPANVEITGGTFSFDPTDYINDSIRWVVKDNGNDTYTVQERELEGAGTEESPYIIKNNVELLYFTEYRGGYFKIDDNAAIAMNELHFSRGMCTFVGGTLKASYVVATNRGVNFIVDGGTVDAEVKVTYGAAFTLKSGSVKSLEIESDAKASIEGGTISGNLTNEGTANMNGGTISGDFTNKGTANMNGGTISGNFTNQSAANMNGVTISGDFTNEAVAIIDNGKFTGTLSNTGTFRVTGGAFKDDPSAYKLEGDTVTLENDNLYHVYHNSSYRTFNITTQEWDTVTANYGSYTKVTDADTVWTTGTYIVTKDTVFNQRVTVNGDVKLILENGVTLTANKGIGVNSGNSFAVYGQQGNTGTLRANSDDNYASIGSDPSQDCGALSFYGGMVEAQSHNGAAIGGGESRAYGGGGGIAPSITIYGGEIEAWINGDGFGESIGTGNGFVDTPSTIKVYGGKVSSQGVYNHNWNTISTWYWNPDVSASSDDFEECAWDDDQESWVDSWVESKNLNDKYVNTGYGVIIDAGDAHVIDLKDCTIEQIPVQDYANGDPVEPKLTVKYNGRTLVEGIHYTVSYSNNTDYTTAAVATITGMGVMTGTNSANFTIDKVQAKYTTEVTAKTELVYNGGPQALVNTGTANGGTIEYGVSADKDTTPTEWTTDVPTETNAGTYYVWVKIEPDGNHRANEAKLVSENGITISEAVMDITVTPKTDIVYDGAALDITDFTFSGNDAAFVDAAGTTVTVEAANTGDSLTSAGSHSVKITIERENSHTFTASLNVTIAQRPVIITPTAGLKSTYGEDVLSGNALTYIISDSDVLQGDTIAASATGLLEIVFPDETRNAGEYAYRLTSTDAGNANYVLKLDDTVKYTIERKDISAIEGEFSMTLDNTSFDYDGSVKSVQVAKVENVENTQSASVTLSPTNGEDSGFIASGGAADYDNYGWFFDLTAGQLTLTIPEGKTAANIQVSYLDGNKVTADFNNEGNGYTGSVVINTLINSTTVYSLSVTYSNPTTLTTGIDYEVTGDVAGTNPGTYTIQVVGKGNYTGTLTRQWTIDLLQITDAAIVLTNGSQKVDDLEPITNMFEINMGNVNEVNGAEVVITYYKAKLDGSLYVKDGKGFTTAPSNVGTYIIEAVISAPGYETRTLMETVTVLAGSNSVNLTQETIVEDGANGKVRMIVKAETDKSDLVKQTGVIVFRGTEAPSADALTIENAAVNADIYDLNASGTEFSTIVKDSKGGVHYVGYCILADDTVKYTQVVSTTFNEVVADSVELNAEAVVEDAANQKVRLHVKADTENSEFVQQTGAIVYRGTVPPAASELTIENAVENADIYDLNASGTEFSTIVKDSKGGVHYVGYCIMTDGTVKYTDVISTTFHDTVSNFVEVNADTVVEDAANRKVRLSVNAETEDSTLVKQTGVIVYRGENAPAELTIESSEANTDIFNLYSSSTEFSTIVKDSKGGLHYVGYCILADDTVKYTDVISTTFDTTISGAVDVNAQTLIEDAANKKLSLKVNAETEDSTLIKQTGVIVYRGATAPAVLTIESAEANTDIYNFNASGTEFSTIVKDSKGGVHYVGYCILADDTVKYTDVISTTIGAETSGAVDVNASTSVEDAANRKLRLSVNAQTADSSLVTKTGVIVYRGATAPAVLTIESAEANTDIYNFNASGTEFSTIVKDSKGGVHYVGYCILADGTVKYTDVISRTFEDYTN